MTLPIIPGPFSFLTSAGQAAGAVGSALTERDRYKQQIAEQNAAFLAHLVGLGVAQPEALASPEAQQLFGRAGIPAIQPSQVEVPAVTAKGRRYNQELAGIKPGTTQSQLAAGVPTAAAAKVDTAQGAEADVNLRALAQITTPEQLRLLKGIVPAEAAGKLEKLVSEKATTELMGQDTERSQLAAHNEIWQSVRRRLPKDKIFDKVADYAAVGGLGYLTSELEAYSRMNEGSKALNTEKIRLITSTATQASQEYRQARGQWETGLKEAVDRGLGLEATEMTPQEYTKRKNELMQDYLARYPMPQFDDFLNQHLQASGLQKEDFQQAFRDLAHIPAASAPKTGLTAVIEAYQKGDITDADVDAATTLTTEQKAKVKASKKKGTK
jgi:hypothetical protein